MRPRPSAPWTGRTRPTVPIVAVTANVFAEDIARTTAAGMNGHIAKPIDFKELQEVLRGLLP